jgi:hypothetical protein
MSLSELVVCSIASAGRCCSIPVVGDGKCVVESRNETASLPSGRIATVWKSSSRPPGVAAR